MPKPFVLAAALAGAGLLACASVAVAQDGAVDVAGWKLSDVGHKPGDDSDRIVSIDKAIPEVSLFLARTQKADPASIKALTLQCLQIELLYDLEFEGWGCMAETGEAS